MQPSFQQSAASAHIEDLVHAAASYRLANRTRSDSAVARGLQAVRRAAFTPRVIARAARHA